MICRLTDDRLMTERTAELLGQVGLEGEASTVAWCPVNGVVAVGSRVSPYHACIYLVNVHCPSRKVSLHVPLQGKPPTLQLAHMPPCELDISGLFWGCMATCWLLQAHQMPSLRYAGPQQAPGVCCSLLRSRASWSCGLSSQQTSSHSHISPWRTGGHMNQLTLSTAPAVAQQQQQPTAHRNWWQSAGCDPLLHGSGTAVPCSR